jgi:hypothetical protein
MGRIPRSHVQAAGRKADGSRSRFAQPRRPIEAEWAPIIGVTYDPKDDLIDVELEGLDHMIHKPRELYVENGIGVASLGIVDADGARQIVKFKDPMMLPPPQLR